MQQNHLYYGNFSEDDRNTFIASMLISAGFHVKDQTRKSTTETGKSAGEVDIFIEDINGYPLNIIEALNLSSVVKDYIKTHIDKIFKNHDFKYPLIPLVEDNSVEFSDLRKFTIVHNRNGTNVNMHHIVMNLAKK
ncbi:hypothetical protein [Chryseobacterium vrystaatense]|uniref:Uncharacterized protein n=1 Tax=Chryseobacterium vrystaatense TaxID=307480 RepID=A0ABR4UIE3_9FLAO|nr:hypothetical protein [Chryseobacterium vrystaatense]KFF24442.1 hypothetical protein IW16_19135 [Chryseobacterium vrystaatense]